MSSTRDHWCGPKGELAQVLADPKGDWVLPSAPVVENWGLRSDPTLVDRWAGLCALACYLKTGKADLLDSAITSFDNCLGTESKTGFDKPRNLSPELNKFPALSMDKWTSGTFIVCDFLQRHVVNDAPAVTLERTPILSVAGLMGGGADPAVIDLVVEALPGPAGLITPDFWSLGLLAFGMPTNEESRTFLQIMHDAFRFAILPDRQLRLRWWLEPRSGRFPTILEGRSAEVAAACVAHAVMNRGSETTPLLDADVAVTATLDRDASVANPDDCPVRPVSDRTIEQKFDAAACAGLVAVLVSEKQKGYTSPEHKTTTKLDGKETERTVLVQPVATLGEAYDGLLITSKAVAEYRREVDIAWRGGKDRDGNPLSDQDGTIRGRWIETETHPDFINASK